MIPCLASDLLYVASYAQVKVHRSCTTIKTQVVIINSKYRNNFWLACYHNNYVWYNYIQYEYGAWYNGGRVMKAEVHCGGSGGWCGVTNVVKYNVVWSN